MKAVRLTGGSLSKLVRSVPITMGSPRFRSLELNGFGVTEAWFPAGAVLHRHSHDRACVGVMVGGSFDLQFDTKTYSCPPTAVFTEPAGDSHTNFVGTAGAHVVVIQPDPARDELLHPFASLFDHGTHRHHAGIANRAARLARELERPDGLSAIASEGIVLEMLVELTRLNCDESRRPPRWLLQSQELVHARFTEPLRVSEVAQAVGVHPAHLARGFRTYFKTSLGSYIRRLRVELAARELVQSEASLATVALAAGFADQSHFTRLFKRHTGFTPNAYRRLKLH
jgi:AraC family transcriptional regulator